MMVFEKGSLADRVRENGVHTFVSALSQMPGTKDLVLSVAILPLLDSICGHQRLRSNEVDKIFRLDDSSQPDRDCGRRCYVIRPYLDELKLVVDQINQYISSGDAMYDPSIECKFWIMFMPRLTHLCDLYLEHEGVYEHVKIIECELNLIPLERDLFSLENEHIFKSLYLNGDLSAISSIVQSIVQLEKLTCHRPNEIHGQGRFARIISNHLEQIYSVNNFQRLENDNSNDKIENQESTCSDFEYKDSKFTDLFIVDRDIDIVSLLLSQLNYEGVLDEAFGIKFGKIEFGPSVTKSVDKPIVKHSLLSSDTEPIYRDIRDQHFTTVFSVLKQKYGEMKGKYAKSQTMDLSSLANFVAKELKFLQNEFKSLALHISACEEIISQRQRYDWAEQLCVEQNLVEGIDWRRSMNYIERCIERQVEPRIVLRLLCLFSLAQGGLSGKDYQMYVTTFCQSYGYAHVITFHHLKRLGWFNEQHHQSTTASVVGALASTNFLSSTGLSSLVSSGGNNILIPTQSDNSSINTNAGSGGVGSSTTGQFASTFSTLTEAARGKVVDIGVVARARGAIFGQLVKRFQLVPDTNDKAYNVRQPADCAFVFGGAYIPLVCQLVTACILNIKTAGLLITPEALKLLPGPTFHHKTTRLSSNNNNQIKSNNTLTISSSRSSISSVSSASCNPNENFTHSFSSHEQLKTTSKQRNILIYFVGGVTFAEMSALRFLAQQRNVNIAVATTAVLNGNRLMSTLVPRDCDRMYLIAS